jgi:ferredoxin
MEVIVNIIFRDRIIVVNEKDTVLETLEKNKIKPYSMCKQGFCATCKMTLKSGSVEYIDEPIAILEDNEILPCICKPTTDIEIDY